MLLTKLSDPYLKENDEGESKTVQRELVAVSQEENQVAQKGFETQRGGQERT